MSIITAFTRDDRAAEIDGCPLAQPATTGDSACKNCRFNVVYPGEAKLGCVTNTEPASYDYALRTLAQSAPGDHEKLLTILRRQRRPHGETCIDSRDVADLLQLAERWLAAARNDPPQRGVAATVLAFAKGANDLAEPIKVLT